MNYVRGFASATDSFVQNVKNIGKGKSIMETARVFTGTHGQTVNIPPKYRLDVEELFITKIGDTLILTPVDTLAEAFDRGAAMLTEDFLADGVPESLPSIREKL